MPQNKFDTPEMLASKMDRHQHRASIFNRFLTAGKSIAGNKKIVILDMSYWVDHRRLDYAKVATQIDGVILRGTYSVWKDTRFDIHYNNWTSVGVPVGAYPYLVGNKSPQDQANAFYEAVGDKELKLDVWADIEDKRPGTKLTRYVADKFMDLTDQMFNKRTEVYTGPWAWLEIMRTGGHSHRRLWIANYGVNEPALPRGGDWTTWWLWQHTDKGKFDGYYSTIDANKFNGTDSDFAAWVKAEEPAPSTLEEQVKDHERRIKILEGKI